MNLRRVDTPGHAPTLRRQAMWRLASALGAAMLVTLAAASWFYSTSIAKSSQLRRDNTTLHYQSRIRQLETAWEREAVSLKTRIEFMHVMNDREKYPSVLASYFTSQAGNPVFSDILIARRDGKVLFGYGAHSQFLPALRGFKGYAAWHFDAPRSALFRVYRQPLWLGVEGMGELLLFKHLNNAMLYGNVVPDTELYLTWQGIPVAASAGEAALRNVDPLFTGSLGGTAMEQYAMNWEGGNVRDIQLIIRQRVEQPMSIAEVAAASLLLYLLLSAFLWLALGRWLNGMARRAAALHEATRLFAERRELVGEIGTHLASAAGWPEDELSKVARALAELMEKVVAGDAERTRFEAELSRQMDKLTQLNAELNDFTHVTSHDLQEPLRKLVIFSEWLERDLGGNLPERAAKDLQFIADAAARMRMLVEDLLSLSRAGNREIVAEKVALEVVVDAALEALALRIAEKDARIERQPLPEVLGDATLLTQLYQNLISNALKYNERRPLIRLDAEREEDAWVVGVRDNGIGINPDYAEQIFQPFKRLHGRGQYEGTGIGLAICRKVAERHHGRIWVESHEGEGAWFRVRLPDRWGGN